MKGWMRGDGQTEQTASPQEKMTSLSSEEGRRGAFEERCRTCWWVLLMRIGKALSPTHRPLCSSVSHTRKGTAVNSQDQSIRPRGAGAPVLTVYPERNGKLESSINRTVRWVYVTGGGIIGGRERRSAGFRAHTSPSWQTRPFPWVPISLSLSVSFSKSPPFFLELAAACFCLYSVFILERGHLWWRFFPLRVNAQLSPPTHIYIP